MPPKVDDPPKDDVYAPAADGCTCRYSSNASSDPGPAHFHGCPLWREGVPRFGAAPEAPASKPKAPVTYSLAEVRNGTGWPAGVRFTVVAEGGEDAG